MGGGEKAEEKPYQLKMEHDNLMHFSAIKWRSLLCSPRISEHKYRVFSLFLLNKEDPFGVSDYIPVFLFAVLRSRSIVRF